MKKWVAVAIMVVALVASTPKAFAQQRLGIGGNFMEGSLEAYEFFAEGRLAENLALRLSLLTNLTLKGPVIVEAAALLALRLGPLLQPYAGGGVGIIAIGEWRPIVALPILLNGLVGIYSSFGSFGIYGQIRYLGFLGIIGVLSPGVGFYMEF